jgi:class 3 adenylate cyclase/tetratricopeptide (TPR) repeat protein
VTLASGGERLGARSPVAGTGSGVRSVSSTVTATFVFTDLVDSTATAARLGPEAAEALRQTHFRLLRGAVSASGGTEVKNLGDGLMVMYSSPSRALAGAAGMQQAIEHHNRNADEPLGVRIGMSAGEAIEEDADYFGDPVVEAARLCALAQGGQILAADVVRTLVGRHATQTFVELGDLELKGLPEPVPTVEVQWEPVQVAGTVPLPTRLVSAASDALFGFFGRTAELEAFAEACKQGRSLQQCQVVFVSGEAGMGKTTLVAQAARAAHGEGAVVLFGHADEDLGVAYQPWIEVVSSLVRHGDGEVLAGLRSAQRGALARLVPEIGTDGDRVGDPDTERLLLLEGTTELLAAQSQHAPVVLVLDDLHWADTASLQLLRHVIGSKTSMDVLIACTYRDTDLGRGDPLNNLLSDLHREPNVSRLDLKGLEDTDVVDLLGAAAGHALDDDGIGLAHAVRRETDGNPFFTSELLRHLGESGGVFVGEDGRWGVAGELEEIGLPGSVRDVVGRRAARLGDEALRVLTLAAVIGREFDLDLLTELADIDEDPLLDLMDAAVAAALLIEGGGADRYRFAHALIQHSLYDELSPARRQRAHKRIAELLEAEATTTDAATLAELARHWVAAIRPADLDKALGYVQRAGDAALAALAPDDAIRWYEQALDLLARRATPEEHQRADLLAALGTAQQQGGYPESRDTLVRAAALAERLDNTEVLVRVALGFFVRETHAGDVNEKRIAAAALERVGREPTPTRARLLAVLANAHNLASETQTRRDLALQAVDAARLSGDEATRMEVVDHTFLTLTTPDRQAEVIDDVERSVALADQIGDPVLRFDTRYSLVWVRYQQYDLAGADEVIAELQAITEQIGLPHQRWRVATLLTGRLLLAGRADEADAANERALELGTAAGAPDALGAFGGLLYNIRRQQGRLDEIADFFLDVARDNPSIVSLRVAIPMLLGELGRIDEAAERLAAEAETNYEIPYHMIWMDGMENLLQAAAYVGDRATARALVHRGAPFAMQVDSPTATLVRGAFARPLACCATVLGEYDQAEEWFSMAHDGNALLQAPFYIALGQLDHADLCLARRTDGDIERARDLVTTAAATAAEYGCAGLTRRADALLADL